MVTAQADRVHVIAAGSARRAAAEHYQGGGGGGPGPGAHVHTGRQLPGPGGAQGGAAAAQVHRCLPTDRRGAGTSV